MPRPFVALSAGGALLTANALRPVRLGPLAVPSFFAGWLTTELAPHNIAVTTVGAAAFLRHGVRDSSDRAGLALSAASVAGLTALVVQSQRARGVVEDALRAGLGADYADVLDPKPTPADLATPWRELLLPFRMRHPDVQRIADVQYHGTHPRHRLDIYRRRDAPTGSPVLLQVHGGGWVIGRKDQQGLPLMLHMAARGWTCVAANYRLAPRTRLPDQIVDLKRALAWIRRHGPEYGMDPRFVAVTGGSAGGHLAALLALTANDPGYQPGFEDVDTTLQAAVPFYGVYDLADATGLRDVRRRNRFFIGPVVMGRDARRGREAFERASPMLRVGPHAPPFLVFHGAHDTLVPVAEAVEFVDRLRRASPNPVVYAELPGTQHAFEVFPSVRAAHVVRGAERFLRWVLATHAPDEPPAQGSAGEDEAGGDLEFVPHLLRHGPAAEPGQHVGQPHLPEHPGAGGLGR